MNKKRFIEFSNYLEGFTRRVGERFPQTTAFINEEKVLMLQTFPELSPVQQQRQGKSKDDMVKETLELAYRSGARQCFHSLDEDIKKNSTDECVESLNYLTRAISNAHKDILYYSALKGQICIQLKELNTPEAFRLIARNLINMSKTHINFLIRFFKLVEMYPRLLQCELPVSFFQKNFKIVESVCLKEKDVWTNM